MIFWLFLPLAWLALIALFVWISTLPACECGLCSLED
jgi:hypothetical protein